MAAVLDYEKYFEEHPEKRVAVAKAYGVSWYDGVNGKVAHKFSTEKERESFIKANRSNNPHMDILHRWIEWN